MQEIEADANDGSVQEIAVNHENPITTEPAPPAKGRNGSAPHSAPFEGIAISVCSPSTDQSEPWEEVDEGETPFAKKNFGQRPTVGRAKAIVCIIVKLPLDRLVSHPENKMLFGATSPNEIEELAESIAETGQQSPIIVTADLEKVGYYAIISGHKRVDALRSMGRTEGNCQLEDVKDADERLLRLLEANRHHVPTTEQKIRIGGLYLGFEAKKAKARQVAGAKAKNGVEVVEVLTQPPSQPRKTEGEATGKARDLAAAKVGISGVSFDKGRKVVQALDKATADGNAETAAKLRQLLNEKGIDPAYSQAKSLHLVETAKSNGAPEAQGHAMQVRVVKKPLPMAPAVNHPAKIDENAGSTGENTIAVGADIGDQAENHGPEVTGPPETTPVAAQDQGEPPVIHIIATCDRLGDDLDALDAGDLTVDQKGNLYRVLDRVANWLALHDEVLQVPARL